MHRFILGLSVGLSSLAAASLNAVAAEGFADLAEKLTPSVVNIAALHNPGGASGSSSMPLDQFLHQFFGDHGDNEENGDSGPAEPPTPPGSPDASGPSVGSGFIIDASGYIVTNNHVIDGGDQIMVTLQDDTTLEASVVGRDTVTDIALLKVNAGKKLPVAVWGDANKSRPGDWVLVIGDPFGLGGTVTAGILSARAREINAGPYDDFLQTDASINRGNSGGPMFNMAGEVIGINTAIYSPSGGSIGIGFAIPSNLARPVVEQIKLYGHPRRGWLGVNIQSVTDEIAENLGLDKPHGALISSVRERGPAELAGIEPGDVVT
ncbi:MAG TPA: trypsin-like peptidase domain-containing protein, partial [Stellaceae bacterium]|nr:trypsin-like peptidase domain-containing protein [Stellaceae bacterium]